MTLYDIGPFYTRIKAINKHRAHVFEMLKTKRQKESRHESTCSCKTGC